MSPFWLLIYGGGTAFLGELLGWMPLSIIGIVLQAGTVVYYALWLDLIKGETQ